MIDHLLQSYRGYRVVEAIELYFEPVNKSCIQKSPSCKFFLVPALQLFAADFCSTTKTKKSAFEVSELQKPNPNRNRNRDRDSVPIKPKKHSVTPFLCPTSFGEINKSIQSGEKRCSLRQNVRSVECQKVRFVEYHQEGFFRLADKTGGPQSP